MTNQQMRAGPNNPGHTCRFYTGVPVFPFGYGLSFTNFTFEWYDGQSASLSVNLPIDELVPGLLQDDRTALAQSFRVNVTNVGDVMSDVSVLAFLSWTALSQPDHAVRIGVFPPIRELFAFDKVMALQPGSTVSIDFWLLALQLTLVDKDGNRWLLPGRVSLCLDDPQHATTSKDRNIAVELSGEPLMVSGFTAAREEDKERLKTRLATSRGRYSTRRKSQQRRGSWGWESELRTSLG